MKRKSGRNLSHLHGRIASSLCCGSPELIVMNKVGGGQRGCWRGRDTVVLLLAEVGMGTCHLKSVPTLGYAVQLLAFSVHSLESDMFSESTCVMSVRASW